VLLTLDSPLSTVPGLSPATLRSLGKESLENVGDVLLGFPFRHEDRRRMEFKGFSPSLTPACHYVRVLTTRVLRFGGRGGVFEAVVEGAVDNPMNQQLTLRWFNMVFMQKALAVGMELIVYGKVKESKTRLLMDHPDYEVVKGDDDDGAAIHTGRIVPVYRLRGGLKQKPLRTAVWRALQNFDDAALPDLLPVPKSDGEFSAMSRAKAIRTLHQPEEMADLERARRYLALEEFYVMQLRIVRRRLSFRAHEGSSKAGDGAMVAEFLRRLPFELTDAQRRCLDEILRDMADAHPMNRLLHGDVGSGKTVVAFAAVLQAVGAGQQAALMAPTQILAEQHYLNAKKWLEPLGVPVSLKTGDREAAAGAELVFEGPGSSRGGGGKPGVFIGTHALLYDEASIPELGLVVIDEQHKFGVAQRARLIARGVTPDILVMTATPIPRTLAITLYGDLDVSTIDQRPKERGKIITAIRTKKNLKEVTKFMLEQITEGRQCYVVYPLIEESEKLDAGAATAGLEEWAKKLHPHRVELLHGRVESGTKDEIMRRFRSGETKVLVSTTVIEVGVDVANATVMLIQNAERFGLAQLHQLRGRIGRGTHASYCVLLVDEKNEEAKARLKIMEETDDGFLIAEEDLKRRGPGDVLGAAQSGQARLVFGDMLGDTRLLTLARRLAERTLGEDPQLAKPEHAALRAMVGLEDIGTSPLQ
jgi:ATP-dependent DNA helicase RecG